VDRISLSQIFSQGLRGMQTSQQRVFNTQGQLSSGVRVQKPSDDPIAAAQILQLNQTQAEIDQYKKNINGGTSALELEDSQMGAITTLLTRVRELAVQAGDGGLAASDRKAIAAEISSRIDELAGIANTRNANGEYIFAGFQGQQEPFTLNGPTYTYRGDDGQRQIQVGSSTFVPINDSGNAIFVAVDSNRLPVTPGVANTGNATAAMGQVVDQAQFRAGFSGGATAGSSTIDFTGRTPVAGNQVIINGVTFTFADGASGTTVVDPTHVTVTTDLSTLPVSASAIATALATSVATAQIVPAPTAAALASLTPSMAGGVVTLGDSQPGSAGTVGRTISYAQGTGVTLFGGAAPVTNMDATGGDGSSSYTVTMDMAAVPPTYTINTIPAGPLPVATGQYVSGEPIRFAGAEIDIVGTPGNGDTFTVAAPATQDMFTTLNKFVVGLQNPGQGTLEEQNQRLSDLISETLDNLEGSQTNVSTIRAKIGARLNTLQSSSDLQDGLGLVNKQVLSEVRDLDYAAAISQLTQENLVLQAAQQSFAKISGLTLFNFIQ
jgi:flagellar hook-associated protein 3 FlgL